MTEYERDYASLLPIAVEQGSVPQILCKYISTERLRYYLEDNTVYFSNFNEMNDKNEARANYDLNNTDEEWIEIFKKINISSQDYSNILSVIKEKPDKVANIILEKIEEVNKSIGVLCLTPENDNILMWTHYADNNKGVCVEFDILEDCPLFLIPKKVEYSDELISLNYIAEQNRTIEPLFHKASMWSYEKEYRVIKLEFHGPRKFKKKALRSIILGVDTPENEIENIRNMVANNGFEHVVFKQAKPCETSIVKYDIINL